MRIRLTAALAVAAATVGLPALAQTTTVEEITVFGRYEAPRGQPPPVLSKVVSFADLDLRRAPDRSVLSHRIDDAARDVCDRLGRARPNHTNVGHACQDEARRDALKQMDAAVAYAMVHPPAYAVVVPVAPAPPDEPYVATTGDTAPDAAAAGAEASYTTRTVTNGPVADTAANRARLGGPMSNAGKRTTPAGN